MAEHKHPIRRKHIPLRTCVICRAKDSKRSLTRLVRTGDGVQIDPTGKMAGRGAYLCDDVSCWERALNTDILNNVLRTTLTAADRARLAAAIPRPTS